MSVKVYLDDDADLLDLQKKVCAVIGFGSQGHAHALNLRDSGIEVIVGLYPGSKSIAIAKEYGFLVLDVSEAAREADVIFFPTPDLRIAEIYEKQVGLYLGKGKTLLFSHGFAIHFRTLIPPKDVDVVMVAPKTPGHIVRRQYEEGKGVPALIAVFQSPSEQGKKVALAWAKAIGATRAGVIETTFREETETDLVPRRQEDASHQRGSRVLEAIISHSGTRSSRRRIFLIPRTAYRVCRDRSIKPCCNSFR